MRQDIFRISIDNSSGNNYPILSGGLPVTHRFEPQVTDMKMHSVFALALGLVAVPAIAQTAAPATAATAAPVIKEGDLVWTADGGKIGSVDSVRDTNVAVITDERMILIPVSSLSAGPHGLVSTLKRKDINRL